MPKVPQKGEVRNPWGSRGKNGNGHKTDKRRDYVDVQKKLKDAGFDPVDRLIIIAQGGNELLAYKATRDLVDKIAPALKSIEHVADNNTIDDLEKLKKMMKNLNDKHKAEY